VLFSFSTSTDNQLNTTTIAFVGAGNMASSIIGGLVESGHPAASISAADPFPASLERLAEIAPVRLCADNAEAVSGADVVILAVKPQVMAEAADSIASAVRASGALVISIAAGITIESMQARLGDNSAIVRCMPNTPALLGSGASALFANERVSAPQRAYAEDILGAVGITRWVASEAELDAITALSGSGPAYFFLFMEAMIDAGCELGLDRDTATAMALQTGLGAARMALESDVDLVELRRRVTSPGGTTERAVQTFENDGLRDLVKNAMDAAAARSVEMARDMG
jgi:pyrroline-5-carboxylate reductase